MNKLNYATFEVSKRLFDAGVVLETENYWRIYGVDEDPVIELVTAKHRLDGWDKCNLTTYPAPSMAEVWGELPDGCIAYKGIFHTEAYRKFGAQESKMNTHPTDALIDLLIWVTEQKRKEKP